MCTSLLRSLLAVLPLLARASTAQVLAAAAAPRAKPSQPVAQPAPNFVIVSEYISDEDHAGGPSGGAEVVAIAPPPPRPPDAALLAAPDAFLPSSALNDTTRQLRRQANPVDQLANRQLAVMTAAGMLNAFQVANTSTAEAVRRAHAANGTMAAGAAPAAQWPPEPTTSSARLLQRAGCHLVPTLRGQQACREQHELGEPKRAVFKDRQTSMPSWRWAEVHQALLDAAGGDPWLVEDLEPYLYDMDYVNPTDEVARRLGPGPSSHLWDPELRETGEMHCSGGGAGTAVRGGGCPVTLYLPELYYAGDEYMGGWALEGFDGEGLRTAIGPNIAPGDDPSRYNYTYIPYAQRITFAPAASLFFPYLMSIYAGEVYIAETDPLLAIIARAARAGIVLDYYYAANYYSSYSFITTGVASAAVFATAARARGVIGAGFKVRNFNAVLASVSRDDYNERNRIILLNTLAFLGTSGGGYLCSVPTARNAFIGQNPTTLVPYYAYDYAGAVNPFPLQPAVGR